MARERKNAPSKRRSRIRVGGPVLDRVRRRAIQASGPLDLDDEELQAIADAGIDEEDVQAIARSTHDDLDVSIFDRDTPRDDLEGLLDEDDYDS